ncbi:MAG TPA: 1,2-phenylacetyl-CoA epoxidase subunit PaaE [Nevskiaceae bacterium]|nr:1,2-phenylacetyl-CoA epoxidase subunit PaaE [Nevskiaceae bacterium]
MTPVQFHPLRVTRVEADTRDATVVTFEAPAALRAAFHYEPGQHLTVRAKVANTEVRRSYSICAAGAEQCLRIAIKRVDDGLFSTWAADYLQPGATLECMAPAGHFGVPIVAGLARHHVAFAAGSGITPVLSIIKTVLETEADSRVTLFYGNRASSTVMFREALEDLKDRYTARFNLVFILSREKQEIDLFNGRIDAAKCDALLTQWLDPTSIDVAYICGPQAMMADVLASLQRHGVARDRIRLELFDSGLPKGARAQPRKAVQGARNCTVTVIQEGRSRSFEFEKGATTVLDAGLDQGVELPYSCKGGVCSTCRCKLAAGEVDMDANYALEDYEVARGYILPCQSFPVSDTLTLNYDE